jgi:hypothetical protein
MKNKERKKSLLRRLSSYDDIKDNFIFTKKVMREERKNIRKERIKETFEDALLRLGVKPENEEDHLNKVYKSLKITSIISFILSILVFCIVTNNIISENGGLIIYAFYFISLTVFTKAIETAFRCYQIRRKELVNIKEYFKNPKEWYPKSFNYKQDIRNGK